MVPKTTKVEDHQGTGVLVETPSSPQQPHLLEIRKCGVLMGKTYESRERWDLEISRRSCGGPLSERSRVEPQIGEKKYGPVERSQMHRGGENNLRF